MKRIARAGALLAAGMLAACTTVGNRDDYLPLFMAAERSGRPFDPITAIRPDATMADAYRVQRDYVRRRVATGDRIAGYKGGLMSPASLRSRNVTEPLVGTLFAAGRRQDGDMVSLCDYRKASFELKLGYVVSAASHAGGARAMVAPVIDLPDIAYRNPDNYSAVDMVAANISVSRYVVGTARPVGNADLDGLSVTLRRDGQVIASGHGRESLGGQAASLELVQKLAARGERAPVPDALIVTGKMGDRGWLSPGHYVADYGMLGIVRFTVSACAGQR